MHRKIVVAVASVAALFTTAMAPPAPSSFEPARLEVLTESNAISTLVDLVSGFTPDICVARAERFRSALPWADQMTPKQREDYLKSREDICVRELKTRLHIS